jgi:hypothetical protein
MYIKTPFLIPKRRSRNVIKEDWKLHLLADNLKIGIAEKDRTPQVNAKTRT